MNKQNLITKSKLIRRLCLERISNVKASHVGSNLSIIDILTYLYYEKMDFTKDTLEKLQRDRFILSKGHAAVALYAILFDKGIISLEEFNSYHVNGSYLTAQVSSKVKGVDASVGSLGHGLAIAAGIAWAYKIDDIDKKVYCMLGDGECNEGTIWETLVFIGTHKLENLIIMIDANKWQAYSDTCDSIFKQTVFINMLKATGLNFYECDGHDFDQIHQVFEQPPATKTATILFFHTIKGKGVSYMENKFEWHYKSPSAEQLKQALIELA